MNFTPTCFGEEVGLPTVSEKQPTHTGHPFVIHIPLQTYTRYMPYLSHYIKNGKMTKTAGAPLFCRTDIPMVRLAMNYGDVATAVKVWDTLTQEHKVLAFKNWL